MLPTGYVITSTSLKKGGSEVDIAQATLPTSEALVKDVEEKWDNDSCLDSAAFGRTTT